MNATGRSHGPFQSDELSTREAATEQRWCRNRPACLRIASDLGWQGFVCRAADGTMCTEWTRPDPVNLREELIGLAMLGRWLWETKDLEVGRGAVIEHPDLETMRADRVESTKRRGGR